MANETSTTPAVRFFVVRVTTPRGKALGCVSDLGDVTFDTDPHEFLTEEAAYAAGNAMRDTARFSVLPQPGRRSKFISADAQRNAAARF